MMVMHLMLMICFPQKTKSNQFEENSIIYDNAAKIFTRPVDSEV
jgi:hypothetical protein